MNSPVFGPKAFIIKALRLDRGEASPPSRQFYKKVSFVL